jgi:hypothetical protein
MIGVITFPRLAAAALIVVSLAACTAPHGAPEGPGEPGPAQPGGPAQVDPWISDDLGADAVVGTSEFGGLPLAGFTCDISTGILVRSAPGATPYATVVVTPTGSGIEHHDGAGLNSASGGTTAPSGFVETLAVDAPDGIFHLSTVQNPQPWSASAVIAFTQVPVPEGTYGCWAAQIWFRQMYEVGTDPAQIVRELTEQGVRDVTEECAEFGYDWAPPNLGCEEFSEAIDTFA